MKDNVFRLHRMKWKRDENWARRSWYTTSHWCQACRSKPPSSDCDFRWYRCFCDSTYIHTHTHKSFLYSAYKFNRVTMRFGRQTSKFSEIVWKCQMTVPVVVVLLEGRSTGEDRWLRSFCHPVCCVCTVRADSAIHWKPTAAGDGRHPTAGNSHQRGTQGSLQQVTGGQSCDLKHDPLSDWKPVQLLQHRSDVIDQARSSVLHRLQTPSQTATLQRCHCIHWSVQICIRLQHCTRH